MSKSHEFTTTEKQFIQDNYLKMSMNEIANFCNVSTGCVRSYYKRNNIVVPKKIIKEIMKKNIRKALGSDIDNNVNALSTSTGKPIKKLTYPFWENKWNPITGY